MTLQASGAITLTNLKNEYGGGSTDIALGNYASKEAAGDTQYYLVGWTGYHFTLAGVSPNTFGSGTTSQFSHSASTKIVFLLDSTVTVPFNITTQYTTDGSSLASSGVMNNGGVYNTSGGYHYVYTQVHIETLATAIGNSGSDSMSNNLYICTNQNQTGDASDTGTTYWMINVSTTTGRNVTKKASYIDFAFPSSFAGGSESSLVGGGTYYSTVATSTGSHTGYIPNGGSVSMRGNFDTAPNGVFNGGGNSVGIFFSGYSHTTDTNLAHNATYGTFGQIRFQSGTLTTSNNNSGSYMAGLMRSNLATTPNLATGSFSTSGWSASWGGSGAQLTCTLTNNTGTPYYIYPYQYTAGGTQLPWSFSYGNSAGQFHYYTSGGGGSGGETQRYGANHYSWFSTTTKNSSGSSIWSVSQGAYHSASANRATLITELQELFNDFDGQNFNNADYRDTGINSGLSRGLYGGYMGISAEEPTTGTLRLKFAQGRSGGHYPDLGFGSTRYINWGSSNACLYATPRGLGMSQQAGNQSQNSTPTETTYPTGVGNSERSNIQIKTGKQNMKMSDYYGGEA